MEKRKILVVEDDKDSAIALKILLEDEGYEVLGAANPTDGLGIAQKQKPDCILLDIMMPNGTEGFQFVWELRNLKDRYVANIPIIVHSAIHDKTQFRFYPDQEDPEYAPGEYLPVQGFLDKPSPSETIKKKIEQVLNEASAKPLE